MLTAEQILASNKAQVETLFGLTSKAFEGVEKLIALNLATSKAMLTETAGQAQTVLSAKDVQELLSVQANVLQPLGEKAASYGREVYDIAAATSAEFGKAFEAQFAEAQRKFLELADKTAQNAPAGSESAVALMKSAVAAANNVLEAAQKSAKQAVALAEANFKAATATTAESGSTASKKR